jgi:hypothetical protein
MKKELTDLYLRAIECIIEVMVHYSNDPPLLKEAIDALLYLAIHENEATFFEEKEILLTKCKSSR